MNNLLKRTLSGSAFVAVMVGAVVWNFWAVAALFTLLGGLCLWEFCKLMNAKEEGSIPLVLTLFVWLCFDALMVYSVRMLSFDTILYILSPCLLFLLYVLYYVFQGGKHTLRGMGLSLMALLYILVPLAAAYILANQNALVLLAVLVVVWGNDVGAYLSGSAFGKHRLYPSVSPKKSWEGFAGGLLVAALVACLMGIFVVQKHGWELWVVFGALVGASAVIGDLFESRLKRYVGVKDSGKFLPGHGGALDRLDAMLFALPVSLMLWMLMRGIQ